MKSKYYTNILKTALLIIAVQFLLASGCNKDGTRPCQFGGYSFNATAEWTPQEENYSVGDTLFFFSEIPKLLQDQINTSLTIDYSNSTGIGGDMGIGYLDSINHRVIPAKDSFDFVSVIGSFSEREINKDLGINFNYTETATNYQFKGAVICRKKGIYGFGVANCLSRGLRGKNCTKAGFDMTVTNTDKHLYLHQYALNVNPNDAYLQQKGYDFRVQ
jgi:hypothetical protein